MKYTFSFSENKVYCVTQYAGRVIRGVAKRHPDDTFDLEFGKKLAKARCDVKLFEAKYKRKTERRLDADAELLIAIDHATKALRYQTEAFNELDHAKKMLTELEKSFSLK